MSIENPLEINKHPKLTVSCKYISNNAGRPKKKEEIKFSPPPKSIISLLLRSENLKSDNNSNVMPKEDIETYSTDKPDLDLKKNEIESEHPIDQQNKLRYCDHHKCTYSTNFSSNLIKHSRIHTSEKPYACDKCIFRTNFQNSLKVHQRIHTLERPYVCQHCDYRCNSSSNLKKHFRHRHAKE